jgi:hypothetical protein
MGVNQNSNKQKLNFLLNSRKGQFFIIFVSILMFIIISIVLIRFSYVSDQSLNTHTKYIFDNIQSDMVYFVNIILNNNSTSQNIEYLFPKYYTFLSHYSNEHKLNLKSFYVLGLPYSNHLNVTIGNHYHTNISQIKITLTDQINSPHLINITNFFHQNHTTYHIPNIFESTDTIHINFTNSIIDQEIVFNSTTGSVFEIFYLELRDDKDTWVNKIDK